MTTRTGFSFTVVGFLLTAAYHAALVSAQSPIDDVSAEDIVWVDVSPDSEHQGRVDRYGDPLPDGVLQRFGTIRYRQAQYGARQLSFLGDGSTILAFGINGQPPTLTDALTGRVQSEIIFKSPRLGFSSAATSSNGRFLLVVTYAFDRDTRAYRPICKLWDATNRQLVASCAWETAPFSLAKASAVSSDGTLVAIGGDRGQIYVWQVGRPEPEVVQVSEGTIYELSFARDDDLIIARDTGSVNAWSVHEQKLKFTLSGFSSTTAMALSSDGRLLAVCEHELAGATLWNLEDGQRVRLVKANDKSKRSFGTRVAFSADGTRLIMSTPKSAAFEVFDVATGKFLQAYRQDGELPSTLAVSLDGNLLAGGVGNSAIKVWTTDDFEDLTSKFSGHTGSPLAIEFTEDGERVISSANNGEIIVWSIESGQPIHLLQADVESGSSGGITTLASSPDDKHLLSLGFGVGLDCWDLETGDIVYHLPRHGRTGRYGAHACGFSSDGTKFFSFGPQLYFRAWDHRTGKAILEERPFPPGATVELDDDGDIHGEGYLFGGALQLEATGAQPQVQASFLSDDAKTLAYVADRLYLVDTSTGKIARHITIGSSDHILLTNDLGMAAVAGRQDSIISIRNTVDGAETLNIETRADSLRPYCFSNDGLLLAVRLHVSQDVGQGTSGIAIYNTKTGKRLFQIEPEELIDLQCASFSPDGTKLAISQANSAILLIDLNHFRVDAP